MGILYEKMWKKKLHISTTVKPTLKQYQRLYGVMD